MLTEKKRNRKTSFEKQNKLKITGKKCWNKLTSRQALMLYLLLSGNQVDKIWVGKIVFIFKLELKSFESKVEIHPSWNATNVRL